MRRVPSIALVAILASLAGVADAQRADPCFTAPVQGQKLQKNGKLLEARERFGICARPSCPAEIVQDCTRWARSVDDALPSVVMAAHDGEGRDLADVTVSVDGSPAQSVSVHALALDPGAHRFLFRRSGAPDVAQEVLLREGEKNRAVVATFGAAVAPPAPTLVTPKRSFERPVPPSAWITGGVGAVALASFGIFAVLGIDQRARDGCATGCSESQRETVDMKFRVADVSLGVGILALGVATWIYLTRPTVESTTGGTGRAVDLRGVTGLRF